MNLLIKAGSSVRLSSDDCPGIVLEIKNGFASIRFNDTTIWKPINEIMDYNDTFFQKYSQGKLDNLHDFVLTVDSNRLEVAHLWDPLVLASATRIDPYPHQLNSVVWIIDHKRIMIADEVGLGKTITALRAVYELHTAHKVLKKILCVVPSSLIIKWKNELSRFNLDAVVIDRNYLTIHPEAFRQDNYLYIASMDFLRQEQVLSVVPTKNIDCVIVDEAHKARRGTKRYKLVKKLSGATDRLIFLTATPHDGNNENFLSLMRLLDVAIETPKMAQNFMLRHTKENVIDSYGKPVFPPRKSNTVKIDLEPAENNVHQELERYLHKSKLAARSKKEITAIRFVSIIFRKRAASSLNSLHSSLKRRYEKLGSISVDEVLENENRFNTNETDLDDMSDEEYLSELYTARKNKSEEKKEIQHIISCIDNLGNTDSKVKQLLLMISALKKNNPMAQLIIFTEYRSTLEYLRTRLSNYSVTKIDGTMPMHEREISLQQFQKKNAEILICTDAAGEGLDMQFCNIEFNYDIPWNPNRLEQRMGRIHRIGQHHEVLYYNFVLSGDNIGADGYVHSHLLQKMENIAEDLGGKNYDLLGTMYTYKQFTDLFEKLENSSRKKWFAYVSSFTDDAIKKLHEAQKNNSKLVGSSVFNQFNPEKIQEMRQNSVDHADIKRFLETFVRVTDGTIKDEDSTTCKIILAPALAQSLDINVITGTYDADLSSSSGRQYLALGDRDVDKMIQHMTFKSPISVIGHPTREGALFAYRIKVFDGNHELRSEKIAVVFCDEQSKASEIDPKSVWDYTLQPTPKNLPKLDSHFASSENYINKIASEFKLTTDLTLDATTKKYEQFITNELGDKIAQLDREISHLEKSKTSDPSINEIIKLHKKKQLEISTDWTCRIKNIQTVKNTNYSYTLLGIAIVLPDAKIRNNVFIDQAGMKAVMDYEIKQANTAEQKRLIKDVSEKSCGYDIESFDNKHIEVKSFSSTGNPSMTSNEWDVARRHGENYWLYVVENAATNPIIHVRRNPYNLYKNNAKLQYTSGACWVITSWK